MDNIVSIIPGTFDWTVPLNNNFDYITEMFKLIVPTGLILPFSGKDIPKLFIECNGQELERGKYNDLFAVINTTYGAGNGVTTFNVPDLRGRFPLGAQLGSNANLGSVGGSGNHKHDLTKGYAKITDTGGSILSKNKNIGAFGYNLRTNGTKVTEASNVVTGTELGGTTDDSVTSIMPPYLALAYIIKI